MQTKKVKPGYHLAKSLFGKFEEIPNDWEFEKIKKLGKIITGSTPNTKIKEYYGDDFFWATPPDLQNAKFVNNTKIKLSKKGASISRIIPKKSVMFSCIGEIGKIGIASESMSTNQQINSVICKNTEPEFVYYQLGINKRKIKATANISIIPIINKKDFGNLSIAIPQKILEQQKIISILSHTDDLVQNMNQTVEQTQRLKKGIMQKLFSKGIDHKKLKKVKWYFDKEIEIPENWEMKPLKKVLSIVQYGLSNSLSEVGKYPIFRMNNIQKGEVLETDMKFIDLDDDEFIKYKLEKNDLLFNRTNSYYLVGKIGIFLLDGDYTFAGYLIRLRTNKETNPLFLNYCLNTQLSQIGLKRYATAAINQSNINATNLKSLIIPVPPQEEQDKIASILIKFDSSINELKLIRKNLELLKKGLMQKLLTGQIRVKVNVEK